MCFESVSNRNTRAESVVRYLWSALSGHVVHHFVLERREGEKRGEGGGREGEGGRER